MELNNTETVYTGVNLTNSLKREKDSVSWFTRTLDESTKVSGTKIIDMAEVMRCFQLVTFIRGIINEVKLMARVFTIG